LKFDRSRGTQVSGDKAGPARGDVILLVFLSAGCGMNAACTSAPGKLEEVRADISCRMVRLFRKPSLEEVRERRLLRLRKEDWESLVKCGSWPLLEVSGLVLGSARSGKAVAVSVSAVDDADSDCL
jgi:hypothetical protein